MTLDQQYAQIDQSFPDNLSGSISAASVRAALKAMAKKNQDDAAISRGWSPVLAVVRNGQRAIIKISDWTGGQGDKPAINLYLGTGGYVTDPNLAQDLRGDAGVGGLPMSLSTCRAQSLSAALSPAVIALTDPRKEGYFLLDQTDTTSVDNGGTILVTAGGCRYKRVYGGAIEADWFGAEGTGIIADDTGANHLENLRVSHVNTVAIQAAIDFAAASSGGSGVPTLYPRNKRRPSVVHVSAGSYFCDDTIQLRGAVELRGDGGNSFGGTVLNCYPTPHHLIALAGPPGTGVSNAAIIRGFRFLLDNNTSTDYACIYSDEADGNSYHSLSVYECWFQLAYNGRAYKGLKADDVLFQSNRFDGSNLVAPVWLGSATNKIANIKFLNNTLYNLNPGFCSVVNVDGLLFTGNTVYADPGKYIPFLFEMSTDVVSAKRVLVTGNLLDGCNLIARTKFPLVVTSNLITRSNTRLFEFNGGGVISGVIVKDNYMSGHWTDPNFGPFAATGVTALSNCTFDNVIEDDGSVPGVGSRTAYLLPNPGPRINNINVRHVVGFDTPANAPENSIMGMGGSTPVYAKTFSAATTGAWSTSTYYELMPESTLTAGRTYLVQLRAVKDGTNQMTYSYLLPVEQGWIGFGVHPDLTEINPDYYIVNYKGLKLRRKTGVSVTNTPGLEGTFVDGQMVGAIVTIRIITLI